MLEFKANLKTIEEMEETLQAQNQMLAREGGLFVKIFIMNKIKQIFKDRSSHFTVSSEDGKVSIEAEEGYEDELQGQYDNIMSGLEDALSSYDPTGGDEQ